MYTLIRTYDKFIYMKSRWFEYKDHVRALRKQGVSMTVIEQEFGIPRSTLSNWFKDIQLTEAQRTKLMKNSQDGWKKAREKAVLSKRIAKTKRIARAQQEAADVYARIPKTPEVLELALAMLYFGEGAKKNATAMGASDPALLRFFISACEQLYNLNRASFRYDLHLRDDQDEDVMKHYWAHELGIETGRIKYVARDSRTVGKPTKHGYHGVCLIRIGDISIQRRLIALYTVYCSNSVGT